MKKSKSGIVGKILVGALTIAATAGISLIVKEMARLLHGVASCAINGVKNVVK